MVGWRLLDVTDRDLVALPTQPSQSNKRRYTPPAPTAECEDAENIDPALLSPKRPKHGIHSGPTKPSPSWHVAPTKRPHFVLVDAPPSPSPGEAQDPIKPVTASTLDRPIAKPTSRINRASSLSASIQARQTRTMLKPKAMSAATTGAGRSPKSKRHGVLNKRRITTPFFRVDPPSKTRDTDRFSIDAALGGTIAGYSARQKPSTAPPPPPPASLDELPTKEAWFFDIHEDTFEDTLTNIMEFSTGILDISDDEDRRREKNDRGKENIPPEATAAVAPAEEPQPEGTVAAIEVKATKPKRTVNPFYRAPLADLPTTDFYEESLSSSVTFSLSALAEEEEPTEATEAMVGGAQGQGSIDQVIAAASKPEPESASQPKRQEPLSWPSVGQDMPVFGASSDEKTAGEVQIWESESAAGDAEAEAEVGTQVAEQTTAVDVENAVSA